jgi:hypothetical protein
MKKACFAFLLFVTLVGRAARADVIDGTVTGGTAKTVGGRFVLLNPPLFNLFGPVDSVGNDNFQSPNLFAFNEAQNVTLTSALTVDVGVGPIAPGAVYFILAAYVPLLLITHALAFRILLRDKAVAPSPSKVTTA